MNKTADFVSVLDFNGNNIASVTHCNDRVTKEFLIVLGVSELVQLISHL